jgi:hypothetical protein
MWQMPAFRADRIEPDQRTGSQIGQAPTPGMESEMARHQPQSHIAEPRQAWLVLVLFGALQGCGSASTAKKSVDASALNFSVPTVNRPQAPTVPVAPIVEEIAVTEPSPSEPLTAMMTIQPKRAAVGETALVLVHIRIASAHFIHAKDEAGGPFVPLAVDITVPDGVEPIGDWQFPNPEKGRGNSLAYRNSVLLRRSLRVVSNAAPRTLTLKGELQYLVCTDELCWPLGKLKLSAPLMIQSQPW